MGVEVIDRGYAIENGVFTGEECDSILKCLSGLMAGRTRAGARNLMSLPEIRELAYDDRLLRIGKRFLKTTPIPYKATLFEKSGKANWLVAFHQDTALPVTSDVRADGWGPGSTKQGIIHVHAPTSALGQILALRIHLDASTPLNGPLRVIPDSHRKRLLTEAEFKNCLSSGSEVECITGRGGVIAMSPLILHASSKSITEQPRRVIHIEYARTLELAPGIRLAIS